MGEDGTGVQALQSTMTVMRPEFGPADFTAPIMGVQAAGSVGRWSGEWTFVSPSGRRTVRPLRHYVYTLNQWKRMFRAAGLRLTGAWSGYAQPYRAGKGSRLLVAGTKPRSYSVSACPRTTFNSNDG